MKGEPNGFDRRGFLAALGGAGAALAFGPVAAACAPARGRGAIGRIGLQLYTVRSLMARDVERTLEQVAAIGYREVEFAGYFDHSPTRLREILDANGLTAPSAHVGFDALEGDGWARTIEHDFEFEPLEGAVPYDIVAGTDPDLVLLQLDIYWIRKAGGDPLTYFRRHPGRFPSVHVKDMAADGAMVEVGAGVIDWRAIVAHADTAGIQHYFVEHDGPDDPLASIRNSFGHLHGL